MDLVFYAIFFEVLGDVGDNLVGAPLRVALVEFYEP